MGCELVRKLWAEEQKGLVRMMMPMMKMTMELGWGEGGYIVSGTTKTKKEMEQIQLCSSNPAQQGREGSGKEGRTEGGYVAREAQKKNEPRSPRGNDISPPRGRARSRPRDGADNE